MHAHVFGGCTSDICNVLSNKMGWEKLEWSTDIGSISSRSQVDSKVNGGVFGIYRCSPYTFQTLDFVCLKCL